MKKIGIITINDNLNCGNRLQNYALQEYIEQLGFDVYTIKNEALLNSKKKFFINLLKYIRKNIRNRFKISKNIKDNFNRFNNNIKFSKNIITFMSKSFEKKYDYFVVGSDQVWKPTRLRLSDIDLLTFTQNHKKISYAASFGISQIKKEHCDKLRKELPKFKSISVREKEGKRIIEEATGIKNVEVVLDPTMLLNIEEWRKVENKNIQVPKKYAFCYFLGNNNIHEIRKFCANNNLEVVIFNKNYENYGPSEFLYLIDNAELILTDSFHGSVFSILFNKEFYVLAREENDVNNNMISRIDTLLDTFKLKSRKIEKIENIERTKCDYINTNTILEEERTKSKEFLEKALDLK